MCAVLQAIQKGFMFIGGAEAAAEVKDGIVICQWQMSQQVIQFPEAIPDVRWVGFMGFLIDLVQLIQDGFAVAVVGIKGVCFDVGFQPLGNLIHCRSAPPG